MEGFEGYPEAGAAGVCWGVSGEGPGVGLKCGDLWSGGLDGVGGPEGGSSRGLGMRTAWKSGTRAED